MIIAISASFVTCCMSINTADFLCQCIVHVLGIIFRWFYSFCLSFFISYFLEAMSDELSQVTEQQVCVQNRRSCPQLWVEFCTLNGGGNIIKD